MANENESGVLGKLIRKPFEILANVLTASQEVGESYKYHAKKKILNIIYISDYHLRIIKGEFTKDGDWIIPKDINKRFRKKKIYFAGNGEQWAILNYDNPASIDIDDPPLIYKDGTKREVKIALDKDGNEVTTIDLKEYQIKGGEVLSSVAYHVGNFPFMDIFRISSREDKLYFLAIGIAIGLIFDIFFFRHFI